LGVNCSDTERHEKILFKNNTSHHPVYFIIHSIVFFNHYSPFSGGYDEQQARNDSGTNQYSMEYSVGI
jgi:hypothetical protein